MHLEANCVDGRLVHLGMNQGWNSGPISDYLGIAEVQIKSDACISLDANECAVLAPIEDYRLDNAAIREDRLLELLVCCTAGCAGVVVVTRTERKEDLLWRRVVAVHFEELPYPRVRAIKLDVVRSALGHDVLHGPWVYSFGREAQDV